MSEAAKEQFDPVKWLTNLVDWIMTQYDKESRADLEIYEKLSQAFHETFDCLSRLKAEGKTHAMLDRETRQHLSQLWNEAATAVGSVDYMFYEACWEKSKYWLSPNDWDAKSVESSGFTIGQLDSKIKDFQRQRLAGRR